MCGRYGFIPDKSFFDQFEVADREVELKAVYNAAPGMNMPVLTMNSPKQVHMYKWGLVPKWAKDPKFGYHTINARGEEIENKPAYRQAFKNGRCLVPASGFFEWKKIGIEGKIIKIPYWIRPAGEKMFGLAGICENGTFSIVTTAANLQMKEIHDRMPVILSRDQEDEWLNNKKYELRKLKDILTTKYNPNLVMIKVADLVNNPANNYPEIIDPINGEK